MELSSVKRQGKDAKGNKINQANFLHSDWWAVCSCLENLRRWKLKSLFANVVLNDNAKAFVRLLAIYSNKTSSTASWTSACALWCEAILQRHLLRFLKTGISQLWLCGCAGLLEVLSRDLTGDGREGMLRMFILREPLLTGTSGREVWEKFRCRFISNLSDFSILLTAFKM